MEGWNLDLRDGILSSERALIETWSHFSYDGLLAGPDLSMGNGLWKGGMRVIHIEFVYQDLPKPMAWLIDL